VARRGRLDVQSFVGKPEGKKQLGRTRCRWEDNIRMDLRKIEWKIVGRFVWLRIGTSCGFL